MDLVKEWREKITNNPKKHAQEFAEYFLLNLPKSYQSLAYVQFLKVSSFWKNHRNFLNMERLKQMIDNLDDKEFGNKADLKAPLY